MWQGTTPPVLATPAHSPGMDVAMTPRMAAGGLVDLKLGHYLKFPSFIGGRRGDAGKRVRGPAWCRGLPGLLGFVW